MRAIISMYPNMLEVQGLFVWHTAFKWAVLSSMATPLEKVYWGTQDRPFKL